MSDALETFNQSMILTVTELSYYFDELVWFILSLLWYHCLTFSLKMDESFIEMTSFMIGLVDGDKYNL